MNKKEKIVMGSGITITVIINSTLGYIVNPILLNIYGYTVSVIVMTIITVIVGTILIKLYDIRKENVFNLENKKDGNKILKFFIFTFVDCKLNIIIFRKGSYLYNGFTTMKVRLLFLTSAAIVNICFNYVLLLIFDLLKYMYQLSIEIYNFLSLMWYHLIRI